MENKNIYQILKNISNFDVSGKNLVKSLDIRKRKSYRNP